MRSGQVLFTFVISTRTEKYDPVRITTRSAIRALTNVLPLLNHNIDIYEHRDLDRDRYVTR